MRGERGRKFFENNGFLCIVDVVTLGRGVVAVAAASLMLAGYVSHSEALSNTMAAPPSS